MSENITSYLAAHIEVHTPRGSWLGKPSPSESESVSIQIPDFLTASATVITAWNPNGQNLSMEENHQLGLALEKDVAKMELDFWTCIGKSADGLHAEESLWILTPSPKERKLAEDLARSFSQEGIFLIDGAVRSLVIFSSDENWTQSMIWARI
jgi:hypothetical protein